MGRTNNERLVSLPNSKNIACGYILSLSHMERYGTYSTSEAVNAGLDLEMPGPSRWRGQLVTHALMANKISKQTLDARVREVLRLVSRVAKTGVPGNAPEGSRDTPETSALLRKIGGESIVLLKNENKALPLNKAKTVCHTLVAEHASELRPLILT